MPLDILRITDPACPFAWSAEPAQAVLRHRYRDQINWSLAMIGLSESAGKYEAMGFTGARMAQNYASFSQRFGMPVTNEPRKRPLATWAACRVVVATRLHAPEREAAVQRALQVAWFTTTADLEQDGPLRDAISSVDGIDAGAIITAARGDSAVEEAFAADRARSRSAEGSPTHAQGKTAMDGDLVRYTAPSLLMTDSSGRDLEAGGFQPVEAYDVIIANAMPTIERHSTESAIEALQDADWPLATIEVASILAPSFTPPDAAGVEAELIELESEGKVVGTRAGNGTFWAAA